MTTAVAAAALDEARALAPDLADRALEGERDGTMPRDLVERIRQTGLFGLALPRSLGGLELDAATIVETVEEICRADGSAGWTVAIGNGSSFFAWMDPSVAAELIGDRNVIGGGTFAPIGRIRENAHGFWIEGRWPFGSGCRHADWFFNGGFVFDGDAPRMVEGRGPDMRLAAIPMSEVEIVDNWDVAGLRGTGSNDVKVTSYEFAPELLIAPHFEQPRHDGPLYRFSFFTLIGVIFGGIPLGIARRALDEFRELAPKKMRPGSSGPMAQEDDVQLSFARAEGRVAAARSFVFDVIHEIWDVAVNGDAPTIEQRARFQLANQEAMRASVEAVDTVFTLAGAGAVYSSHPLQRCFRDIHTACQHVYWAPAASKRYAKATFGIEQPSFML